NCREFLLATRDQVMRNLQQKFALGLGGGRKSQIRDNVLQEFQRRQPSVKNVGVGNIFTLPQRLQKAAQQQCFSGSHFAGQDDETFVPPHPVIKCGQRFVMPPCGKQERRVRSNLKRIPLQIVK